MGDVVQSNCIALLSGLEDESVPLICTDPPYGIGYHSNRRVGRNPHAPITDDWDFAVGPMLEACRRALRRDGALYVFTRWDVSPFWLPWAQAAGFKLKSMIAWVKDNHSAGDLKGSYGNKYEQIMFLTRDDGRHLLRGKKRYSNVWNFPRVPPSKLIDPAQKPVPMLERIIECSSDRGDLVVDPMAGSGSFAEAAAARERDYLLGDVDPRQVRSARVRLGLPVEPLPETEEPPDPVFDAPDPREWGIHPEDLAVFRQVLPPR